jgi:hypothetical protein
MFIAYRLRKEKKICKKKNQLQENISQVFVTLICIFSKDFPINFVKNLQF